MAKDDIWDEVAFKIIYLNPKTGKPDQSKEINIYLNGKVTGIEGGYVIVNRYPVLFDVFVGHLRKLIQLIKRDPFMDIEKKEESDG
ncbi:hypothetical protein LCGC14_1479020 [marine sediment metagenome]|uniref:Uncharacterized protein n=1 Tax=marine sediment metagenome TaxID=412755 RepID=A0A0F9JW13_9ZZZZ|nr:hypothetical protein [Candidatus Aminicenantes bacterium]